MRGFDRAYMALKDKPKTCRLKRRPDLFDGREWEIDEFYEHHKRFFDAPCEFFKDFGSPAGVNLRDGRHPGERIRSGLRFREMIFDCPRTTGFPENDIVPFKWFQDDGRRNRAILLFAPGWGRSDQDFEEGWSARLMRMGLDVGLLTVPYHQARAPQGTNSGEYWISSNLYWTIDNFRLFTSEIRLLVQYMRGHYDYVGLLGMSSGGFQTALAANCEEVDFFYPVITGGILGGITWHGRLTQVIRRELEGRGVTEADLTRAWSITDEVVLGRNCRAKYIKQYISLFDEVVPTRYQVAMWEALGKPDRMDIPSAHYSVIFFGNMLLKDIACTTMKRMARG